METADRCIRYKKPSKECLACFDTLNEGASLHTFMEIWEEDLSSLFYFLEELHQARALSYTAQKNGKQIACLHPFSMFVWKGPLSDKIQLSRFALIRNENRTLILESPLAQARIEILDPMCLEILHQLKEPIDQKDVAKEDFPLIELLSGGGFLEASNDALQIWEFHDLLFHSRSRLGRMDAPYGGTFRFEGKLPPYPAEKPIGSNPLIPLPKEIEESNPSFYDVLKSRRSIRELNPDPISLEQLGTFLYQSAAARHIRKEGKYEAVFRNSPGGGACHPIEIYPIVMQCKGLEKGFYRYHRVEHALSLLAPYSSEFDPLIAFPERMLCQGSKTQVLLIFSARFGRTMWKYQSMGYATILKDVGAMMQTMYLVATAMGLAPCANGGGNSDLFAKISGLDYLTEGSVGEFFIGTKANKR